MCSRACADQFHPLRCGMIEVVGAPKVTMSVSVESRRDRRFAHLKKDGVCDDCFTVLLASGDFTLEELEKEYPKVTS